MKNYTLVGLIGILLLIYGCSYKENKFELDKFGLSVNLKGKPVEEIPIYTTRNVHMMVMDTFLIIQTREEKFFKIYSTQSYQFLGEFGDEGDGPSDFRFPHLSKEIYYSQKGPILSQIFDKHLKRQYTIPINNILKGIEYEGKPFHEISNQIVHNYYQNDKYLWGKSENVNGRFFHYNFGTGEYKIIPYIPETNFPIKNNEYINLIYRSAVITNEEKGLVAAAPYLLGQIDFFKLSGEYLKTTFFEKSEVLQEALESAKIDQNLFNPKVFISDLDASVEFIYGLSRNNLGKEIRDPQVRSPHKILVFDWDGNPMTEYVLDDGRYVFSIAVDEKNKRIYAYCPEEEEHNLIVYNYP